MLVLVKCFSGTPDDTSSGVSLTHLMLVLVTCFSYTPHASFSEVFLLHS